MSGLIRTPSSPSTASDSSRVQAKFGVVGDAGYQAVPNMLLFHQSEIGLRSEDLNVLLNITAHWFFRERLPFPRSRTIAKRMGVSERTVQRSLSRLREQGLILKTSFEGREAYDVTPLLNKLEPFAAKHVELRENFRRIAQEQEAQQSVT